MFEWGDTLLRQHNTKRYKENDVTLNYIGYWTDGGNHTLITFESPLSFSSDRYPSEQPSSRNKSKLMIA